MPAQGSSATAVSSWISAMSPTSTSLERAREMLYVGMSRARSKLVLVGDMAKIQELTAVAEEP